MVSSGGILYHKYSHTAIYASKDYQEIGILI